MKNNLQKKSISVNEVQNIIFNIMLEIDRVCRKNDIEYMLIDGTLLGAIRHKGFIPWDDDADIIMTRKNFDKFKEIASEQLADNLFVQTIDTDKNYNMYNLPMKIRDNNSTIIEERNAKYHQGIYVDIFIADNLGTDVDFGMKLHNKAQHTLTAKRHISKRDFFSIKWIKRTILQLCGKLIPVTCALRKVDTLRNCAISNGEGDVFTYHFGCGWSTKFYKKDLFPVSEIEFNKHMFLAPHNPAAILEAAYGDDYMTLPPESERVTHSIYASNIREF